jgi:pimeloyl-ACP methyl ester carboxylesterase
MAASVPLSFTDPPQRLLDELGDGSVAQHKLADVERVVAELPDMGVSTGNRDAENEQLGETVVMHRFVAAPGDSETVTWHFVEAGDSGSPTVVFLHGVPDSWWQWHYALEALSGEYHCIAVDLKGYGQSDKRTGDYRQCGVAEQLEALLDEIGVDQFALVTHDRGTPVGDHLASRARERLTGYARGQQHLWHLHPSLHPQEGLFLSPEAPALLADARRFVVTAYSLLTKHPVAISDLARTATEFGYPGIATAVPRYFHSSSFRQEWIDRRTTLIPSWTAPVLLMQGMYDPMQPHEFYSDPAVLTQLPPGSSLRLLDAGHFWPFEAPQETVATIEAFLGRIF